VSKYLVIFVLAFNLLFASDVIHQRQDSMQNFNKLMRSATQTLNSGETNGLEEIYAEIEAILIEYPTLFPDDSFVGKTKASTDIIDNRDAFNQISQDASDWAALAKISAKNGDLESIQQHHQNLYSSCKSCHSRFRN
jgi:cytochrome c556|tara:strand:+ start:192 stop:602 length:411 start_codon:yes stop_codon:yes gene_type:complete